MIHTVIASAMPDSNNLKSEVKKIVSGNLNPSARDELLESGMADAMTV